MLNRVASELHRARGVGSSARQQARPRGCSTWSQAVENHGGNPNQALHRMRAPLAPPS